MNCLEAKLIEYVVKKLKSHNSYSYKNESNPVDPGFNIQNDNLPCEMVLLPRLISLVIICKQASGSCFKYPYIWVDI